MVLFQFTTGQPEGKRIAMQIYPLRPAAQALASAWRGFQPWHLRGGLRPCPPASSWRCRPGQLVCHYALKNQGKGEPKRKAGLIFWDIHKASPIDAGTPLILFGAIEGPKFCGRSVGNSRCALPLLSTVTGTISSLNHPCFCASRASHDENLLLSFKGYTKLAQSLNISLDSMSQFGEFLKWGQPQIIQSRPFSYGKPPWSRVPHVTSQVPPSCGNPPPCYPADPGGCHRLRPRFRWWGPWAGGTPRFPPRDGGKPILPIWGFPEIGVPP